MRTIGELPRQAIALNGLCPYFTMFPLDFPYTILQRHHAPGQPGWVLDPFCGRGTTNYAARLLGLPSVGIDSSPVAVAITQAKLANTTPERIVRAAWRILEEVAEPGDVPEGEFWDWAFHRDTLHVLCRLREGLLRNCRSDARKALRAIILGALHGPRPKSRPSYFSNQAPRTYAPKPRYAVRFWKERGLAPERVGVLEIIETRAQRYYGHVQPQAVGRTLQADSRKTASFARLDSKGAVRWVITSPPYYGMRTYLPDQWLRSWFVGGPPTVDYSSAGQMEHASPERFAAQMRQVWRNTAEVCAPNAQLVVRFGGINDRKAEPMPIVVESLKDSGWEIERITAAGTAAKGRRQSLHFSGKARGPIEEHDVWAVRV